MLLPPYSRSSGILLAEGLKDRITRADQLIRRQRPAHPPSRTISRYLNRFDGILQVFGLVVREQMPNIGQRRTARWFRDRGILG